MRAHDSESRATLRQKTDSRSESCKRNGSLVRLQVSAALSSLIPRHQDSSALAEPADHVTPS